MARAVLDALAMATQDLRYALRTARRTPGVTAAALLVLGLGIGATTVMFTLINSVVLAPLALPEPDRLVSIHTAFERRGENWGASNPDFGDLRRQSRSLALAAWGDNGGTITEPGDPEYVDGAAVSANLIDVLRLPLDYGRTFRADDDRPGAAPVAIISTRLWQRRFGSDPSAVGRRLVFNGTAYTVIGIAAVPPDMGEGFDVLTPLGQDADPRLRNREARFMHLVGRLRDRATLGDAATEVGVVAGRLATVLRMDAITLDDALRHPEQIRAAWQDTLDRARRVPGVTAAALADVIPMRGGINPLPYSTTAAVGDAAQGPVALATSVTPDYARAMGLSLRRGRFVGEQDDAGSEPVVVVDETLSHHAFGSEDPVGKQLWVPALGPTPVRVIGVVGHVRHWGLAADDASQLRDQLYYPLAQVPPRLLRLFSSLMSIVVRTQVPPASVENALRRQLRGISGDQALYAVRTMEEVTASTLDEQRFLAVLFGVFASLALLLACIGIYGVLSYVSGLRVREFGVRMALGATATTVRHEVLGHSAAMIGVGLAVGGAGAYAASRAIARIVDGVRPADPSTFAIMAGVLAAAALLASLAPAWRASRVDPLVVLRQE